MKIVQLKAEMMHIAQVIMPPFIHLLTWERFYENLSLKSPRRASRGGGRERAEIKGIGMKDLREIIL